MVDHIGEVHLVQVDENRRDHNTQEPREQVLLFSSLLSFDLLLEGLVNHEGLQVGDRPDEREAPDHYADLLEVAPEACLQSFFSCAVDKLPVDVVGLRSLLDVEMFALPVDGIFVQLSSPLVEVELESIELRNSVPGYDWVEREREINKTQ